MNKAKKILCTTGSSCVEKQKTKKEVRFYFTNFAN